MKQILNTSDLGENNSTFQKQVVFPFDDGTLCVNAEEGSFVSVALSKSTFLCQEKIEPSDSYVFWPRR